ncbi:MAG: ATP-binding protein [Burkholderiaceae bacterium]|jgi:type II secretory pathway predicted ATPase ExeA|nr:ATP-binding protein [Burkholderiaceae bacterium]MEB2317300.1 ATP-binding protein [Pseudomonadota bacterium]
MDPRLNPYAPGAGTPPPELAGRESVIEKASIALDRIRNGLAARSLMLVGLRGVGKTVLLNRLHNDAEAAGFATVMLEAPERRSLPALLAPALRAAVLKLDRMARGSDLAQRALRGIGGFVQAMKLKYHDIEFGIDLGVEPGLADTGDLDADLIALLRTVGEAARERKTAVALFIDELQYVEEAQLAALISALHRCSQLQLPVTLIGAGLPQLIGQMGKAKSYAERLFEFTTIGRLPDDQARRALIEPATRADATFDDDALREILAQTRGYPYFLQEWGKHSWNCADQSPIRVSDVTDCATVQAIAELDQSFFRVRLDRLTPAERRYMRAMAELGPGPHRSGDIAGMLGREVRTVAPIRSKLIDKGMIYSPAHGDTAFTVPLFDEFMRRIMPGMDA